MPIYIGIFAIGLIVALSDFIHDSSVKHTEKVTNKVLYLRMMK